MEYEVRFYYNINKLNDLLSMLRSNKDLVENIRTYEKTIQYNHSDPKYDFYSKEIDGRFRLRISKNDKESKAKLSWKRRLNENTSSLVNKEEEKEVNIDSEDFENFEYIIENVMHFTIVESYERYRTTFTNDDIEISLDEYPFGIALEVENKSTDKNGILGGTVNYENYSTAFKKVLHVIKVKDNSFSKDYLHLDELNDYLIALKSEDNKLQTLNNNLSEGENLLKIFSHIIKKNIGRKCDFYIYNKRNGGRIVNTIIPNSKKFELGCDVAFGMLHEIPFISSDKNVEDEAKKLKYGNDD